MRRSKACQQCGEKFNYHRSDARYCSNKCRQTAYAERHRIYNKYKNDPGDIVDTMLFSQFRINFSNDRKHISSILEIDPNGSNQQLSRDIYIETSQRIHRLSTVLGHIACTGYISIYIVRMLEEEIDNLDFRLGRIENNRYHFNRLVKIIEGIYFRKEKKRDKVLIEDFQFQSIIDQLNDITCPFTD